MECSYTLSNVPPDTAGAVASPGSTTIDMGEKGELRALNMVYYSGTVNATVTQICVRTGECFNQEVYRGLGGGVVMKKNAPSEREESTENAESTAEEEGKKVKKKKKKDKAVGVEDVVKMAKVAAARQEDEEGDSAASFDLSFDDSEDFTVIEDDDTIVLNGARLDLGELSVQEIVANLDPYPKKPGSEPVRYSSSWK